tara:strand:+ start:1444 stop:1743 length:300 start_codon:yes stop_codon:yes gene_type:complete
MSKKLNFNFLFTPTCISAIVNRLDSNKEIKMKIKLQKKTIKQLSKDVKTIANNQTPHVAGGTATQGACYSFGCDTAVFLGCPTGQNCYSARNEICMPDY